MQRNEFFCFSSLLVMKLANWRLFKLILKLYRNYSYCSIILIVLYFSVDLNWLWKEFTRKRCNDIWNGVLFDCCWPIWLLSRPLRTFNSKWKKKLKIKSQHHLLLLVYNNVQDNVPALQYCIDEIIIRLFEIVLANQNIHVIIIAGLPWQTWWIWCSQLHTE